MAFVHPLYPTPSLSAFGGEALQQHPSEAVVLVLLPAFEVDALQ
jgi:hypothetical protein